MKAYYPMRDVERDHTHRVIARGRYFVVQRFRKPIIDGYSSKEHDPWSDDSPLFDTFEEAHICLERRVGPVALAPSP